MKKFVLAIMVIFVSACLDLDDLAGTLTIEVDTDEPTCMDQFEDCLARVTPCPWLRTRPTSGSRQGC